MLALVAGGVYFTRSGDDPVAVPYKEANIDAPESPDSAQTVTIETRLYLPQQTPAPAIMLAHGFGGSLRSVHTQAEEFARRGFVVLTWSARGFGRSTGQIALNSIDREVRDAQKLLDFLATRDEVQKDKGGDPRVGVTGASYGGALSLLLAGVDKRVDTLVPVITYNDLAQALLPNSALHSPRADATPAATAFSENGVFKRSWAGIFFSAGMTSIDLSSPTGDAPEVGQTEANQPAAPSSSPAGTPVPGPSRPRLRWVRAAASSPRCAPPTRRSRRPGRPRSRRWNCCASRPRSR